MYSTDKWLVVMANVAVVVSGLQGRLAFNKVNTAAPTTQSNFTTKFRELFSMSSIRDSRDLSIHGREFVCPPGYPLECPDGLHCTTPDYDVCCPNQAFSCQTGGSCCDGGTHCAPPGGFCCGETACEGGDVCCPTGCGVPGSTCCGANNYCLEGQPCCGEGCADVGHVCCGTDHQCDPGEQCCQGSPNGCAPETATCCGPELYCDAGALCCQDTDGDYFCSPGPQCIDSMILDLADYHGFDEVFENICRGILQSPYSGKDTPNEMILSFVGTNEKEIAAQHRKDSGCAGSPCAKIFSTYGPNGEKVIGWSCDEFPFAASDQGGTYAAIICVPQSDNSAIGNRWKQAVAGKAKGTQIRVKVKGVDCSTVPLDKRSTGIEWATAENLVKRAGGILKNDTDNLAIYVDGSLYGNSSGGAVAMIIPFDVPYDFEGTFNVNYTITSGTIKSGSLGDDWGDDFGEISITDSGQTASGTIEVGPDGVGNVMMIAWADNTELAISYTSALTTTVTPETSSAPTTSRAPKTVTTKSTTTSSASAGPTSTPATSDSSKFRDHMFNSWFWVVSIMGYVLF